MYSAQMSPITSHPQSPAPSTQPPSHPLTGGALTGLEVALERVRAGSRVEEETLVGLAWESFMAGFSAREGDTARPNPPHPTASEAAEPNALSDLVDSLTPRRLEVLKLVARGLTNREIGQVLGISSYTVKSHLAALFETLDVSNRTEAAFALQQYEEPQPQTAAA